MTAPAQAQAPFRADHVGSLLRPAALAALRAAFKRGEADAATLRAAEDAAIREAVARQQAVGLRSLTDGEFRRDWWHLDFLAQLDGVTLQDNEGPKFRIAGQEQPPIATVTGRVACSRPIMAEHFAFLKGVTTRTPKMTIPSPSMLHLRGGRAAISRDVYPDLDAFWDDVAAAYRQAIAHLADAGCRYLQLDDITFAYLCDPKIQAQCRANRHAQKHHAQKGDKQQGRDHGRAPCSADARRSRANSCKALAVVSAHSTGSQTVYHHWGTPRDGDVTSKL